MMTFSVVWILLAAMVTLVAMMRRAVPPRAHAQVQVRQSGRALSIIAILYSLVLIAGFLYISWQTAVH